MYRRRSTILAIIASIVFCLSHETARADVPALAKVKAAAEAGDPEAQFRFAKSFSAGGADWKRWISAAASQGYGPAEDELAWIPNWANFATEHSDPKVVAYVIKSSGVQMRQGLVLASSAADKGFNHSRLLLAYAYAHGYLLSQDRVEAYKWVMLAGGDELLAGISTSALKNKLLKTMSLPEVKEGETRAANYRPGGTVQCIRNALIVPKLKLTGLASSGGERVAIVNGSRLVAGKHAQLNIDGLSVPIVCLSVDEKTVVVSLPPDISRIVLQTGAAPVISP